jgi:NADPH:quinone reductase-like Zn-dependent oxidoreductase
MTTVPKGGQLIALFRKSKTAGTRSRFTATGLRPNTRKRADLAFLHNLAASGALRGTIGRTFRLEDTADAHRYVETGHKRGSAIIAVVAEDAARKALAA